jgi:hypothetical protein
LFFLIRILSKSDDDTVITLWENEYNTSKQQASKQAKQQEGSKEGEKKVFEGTDLRGCVGDKLISWSDCGCRNPPTPSRPLF